MNVFMSAVSGWMNARNRAKAAEDARDFERAQREGAVRISQFKQDNAFLDGFALRYGIHRRDLEQMTQIIVRRSRS